MTRPPATLGYLTSVYGRASDSFIRSEVAALRAIGHQVHTFSIRRPAASEVVGEDVRREQANTEAILDLGFARLAASTIAEALRSPRGMLGAARLAMKVRTPGIKGSLWPLAYLMEAAYLAARLRAKGVEHLHNHIGEGSAAVAMIAAELAGIPFSLTMHGPNEFDKPGELALAEKVGRSAFTVAVSEFGRSQLFRWVDHADWPKVRIVHCGVDPIFLADGPAPIPPEPRLVCVGRLAEQKGQLLLVEAAGRLAAEGRDFQLVLVGDGPMRGPIEALIAGLGLESRVEIAGWASGQVVREQILRSRALVIPSFAEGLPVVIMEALALGRPVISTYIAGIPELVEPGACGWLVPAGSVDALALAMGQMLDASDDQLARMGAEGARRVAERHDSRIEAAKLSALIDPRPKATRPAVFLDRDGTIIEHVHYLTDPAGVRLLAGAAGALRRLADAGFALITVTNQSAIARGMLTLEQLALVHDEMVRQLAAEGVAMDGIYHCPEPPMGDDRAEITHPDRKPGPGMLLRASGDLGIDLATSWMVGDMISDVLAGANAGCRGSVLVLTGKGLADGEAREGEGYGIAADLPAAADIILESRHR